MDKVTYLTLIGADGLEVEHAIIEHADGSFTSMTKEHYEKQQVALSTPMVSDEAASK